jgi:hypothetical protein
VIRPIVEAAVICGLRAALAEADYTEPGIDRARRAGGPDPGSRLRVLLDLFDYGRCVAADDLARALAPLRVDQARGAGLVEPGDEGLRAALHVQPYQQWWILSDLPPRQRRGPVPRDYVLGAGGAATALAAATMRTEVGSALDLCSGGGVQALGLCGHARKVTGTDLSPRALRFAAANALLNGLDWRLAQGSFAAPVRGQQFDLVVCNPPFIVGPGDVSYLYRDAGMRSDDLGAFLAGLAPQLLSPGGCMQYLASWTHGGDTDWRDRVSRWLAPSGMDAWAVQLDRRDVAAYVRAWTNDPGSASDRAWLRWFHDQGVEAISLGLITLRNAGRDNPVIRLEDLSGSELAGGDVAAWLALQDWLDGRDLLSCRFRPAEGARLQSAARFRAGTWESEGYQLTVTSGARRIHQASDLVVALVSRCDGTAVAGDLLASIAQEAGIPAAELREAAIPAIIELIEHQVLVPAEASGRLVEEPAQQRAGGGQVPGHGPARALGVARQDGRDDLGMLLPGVPDVRLQQRDHVE